MTETSVIGNEYDASLPIERISSFSEYETINLG
jgi:hypothetical protein